MASPLRPLRAEKCNPCLRNVLLPMSRNGHLALSIAYAGFAASASSVRFGTFGTTEVTRAKTTPLRPFPAERWEFLTSAYRAGAVALVLALSCLEPDHVFAQVNASTFATSKSCPDSAPSPRI